MRKYLCLLLVAMTVLVATYCLAGTQPNQYQNGVSTWRESDAKNNHFNPDNKDNVLVQSRKWHTWDDVKGIWHSKATHQLTNWTFSHDMMTVQLVNKDGKVTGSYLVKPYNDKNSNFFVFSENISAGTQIVVPEGCELHANPAFVDMSGRKPEEYGAARFHAGEVVYFTKAPFTQGFIIFPMRLEK